MTILYTLARWAGRGWSFLKRHVTAERVRVLRDLAVVVAATATIVVVLQVRDLQQDTKTLQIGSAERGKENQTILKNTSRAVAAIEGQTSAETLRRQRELIDQIIGAVDCNNQAAIQRVIDVLVERQILEDGDVQAITDACLRQQQDQGGQ